jgi:hypothetical protein
MKRLMVLIVGLALLLSASAWAAMAGGEPGSTESGGEITDVQPISSDIRSQGGEAIWAEISSRVETWGDQIGVEALSDAQLAADVDALSHAISLHQESEDWWLSVQELNARRALLCGQLPTGHAYRGGEYCD